MNAPSTSLSSPPPKLKSLWMLRGVAVVLALIAWFWTQSLIGKRNFSGAAIGDALHAFTAPVNLYLLQHASAANGLLILSSALIDSLGLFLLARGVFGPSIRPFLSLLLVFTLRQLCQGLCALPVPAGMIWRSPGFPSLFVTYGVANDLFFSGHTAIAVLGAVELASLRRRWLAVLGILIAFFEVATVLVLRAHYTMDVFAGAVAALLVARVSPKLAPPLDRLLARALSHSH